MNATVTTLGDHVSTQKGFAFKSGWFCDSGRAVVKVKDFTADSVDPADVTHVSDEIAAQHLKYELRTGDVVIQTVGSWPSAPASVVGKCVRIPRTVDRALLNQNAVRLTPSNTLDGGFLYYLLKNPAFSEYIVGTAQGAASQAAITLEAIRAYKINLPPLPTQRKIAGTLSAYDDLIENNLRRIKILEEMAQSLYREWFVHFRFPGHESARFTDSSLGRIPEEWEVLEFREIFDIRYGKTLPKAEIAEVGPYPVYGAGSVIGFYHKAVCLEKSALVTSRGNGSGTVWRTREAAFVTNNSLIILPRTKYRQWKYPFVEMLLKSSNVMSAKTGSAQPQVTIENLNYVEAIVPSESVAIRFCNLVTPIYEQVDCLFNKCKNLRRTRDLLLPSLLNSDTPYE